MKSKLEVFKSLPIERRKDLLSSLGDQEIAALKYDWSFIGRPEQQEPEGDWDIWLILAGRGWGKSRTGAEFVRKKVEEGCMSIAIAGRNADDVRKFQIVKGLMKVFPPGQKPVFKPGYKEVHFHTGAIGYVYYGSEPDSGRGANSELVFCDELCFWQYDRETFNNLMLGLRIGNSPKCIITTTPKPSKLLKELMSNPRVKITTGTTFDNQANLSSVFFNQITRLDGTRLGRQELYAQVLEDNPNALWKTSHIEPHRVREYPELKKIVVSIDPAVTSNEDSAETGITIAGKSKDNHYYIIKDSSMRATPKEWCSQAVADYNTFGANFIIGEVNNGGDLIETTLRFIDERVSYRAVRATRGKYTRAEPVHALYEKGLVHHVGSFPELENQMTTWSPGETSPDRLDSLVWAITFLADLSTASSKEKVQQWSDFLRN